MFVAGLAVSVYIHFGIGGGGNLPFSLGFAFGFAALPAVVIFPWRWVQKRRGKFTDMPIIVGAAIFIILAYSQITVANFEARY